MIAYSDNAATNLVIDQIGLSKTNEVMSQLGYVETRLNSKVYGRSTSLDQERSKQYGLSSTRASEMLRLLSALQSGQHASPDSTTAMLDHLRTCEDKLMAVRYLDPQISTAHKTGAVSASRCDAGIIESPVGAIAFCFLTTDNEDRSWGKENEAELLISECCRIAYEHFNDKKIATAPAARVLRVGDDGELVAFLQRTLVARSNGKISIAVDGDFGPNTEQAVKIFQEQVGLNQTGRVDAKTWRALGPLVTEEVTDESDKSQEQELPVKSSADLLDGPPIVASKAYAIADGVTGELLWGMEEETPLHPASTTKIMTAHLAISMAENDPDLLDEQVVFSQLADSTPGSSCDLTLGETLTFRELLHGVMLPSGNDASVALGEFCGGKLGPVADNSSTKDSRTAYERFIIQMNQEAKRLGMNHTTYKNTSGLTEEGHLASAADLTKLAYAAMKSPLFREIVVKRRYTVQIGSLSGYVRNIKWRNTNRLLNIEGFSGVKTGTTGPAGACLVSSGERDGRSLIIAVLGAKSSDSRYVDSRNLYRWAWNQLLTDSD